MLLLFDYITRSSSLSLEEVKLSAIVNWIFHVSDFLGIFIIFFNFIKILFKWWWLNSIKVTFINYYSKNYLIYWFITIFFLMLKKVPNISNYSVLIAFFLFFFSLKTFFTFLIIVSSISCFSLKWSLIMFSSIFCHFEDWNFFYHYML